MEFWGVEIKPGKPLKVTPEEDYLIHISQASLGESKKGAESVPLFVKVGDQKLVLGTLLGEKLPQISFDLVFDQEFELSHNWKNGSVFVLGYKSPNMMDGGDEDMYSDLDDSEEEDLPIAPLENGKTKGNAVKVEKVEPVEAKKEESDSDDEDDEDDESDDASGSDDSDEMGVDEDSEDDESDDEDEDDEETPKKATPKAEQGKKRPNGSETKTSVQAKKAKITTPQNTEGKKGGQGATPKPAGNKGGQGATPNPAKSGKKGGQSGTPNSAKGGNKSGQSPKSGGQFGQKSHNKAKHSGK